MRHNLVLYDKTEAIVVLKSLQLYLASLDTYDIQDAKTVETVVNLLSRVRSIANYDSSSKDNKHATHEIMDEDY